MRWGEEGATGRLGGSWAWGVEEEGATWEFYIKPYYSLYPPARLLSGAFELHVVAVPQVRKGREFARLVARQWLLHEGAKAAPQLGGGRAEDVEHEQPLRRDRGRDDLVPQCERRGSLHRAERSHGSLDTEEREHRGAIRRVAPPPRLGPRQRVAQRQHDARTREGGEEVEEDLLRYMG